MMAVLPKDNRKMIEKKIAMGIILGVILLSLGCVTNDQEAVTTEETEESTTTTLVVATPQNCQDYCTSEGYSYHDCTPESWAGKYSCQSLPIKIDSCYYGFISEVEVANDCSDKKPYCTCYKIASPCPSCESRCSPSGCA